MEQKFEIKNTAGRMIRGKIFTPDGNGPYPTIIHSHGFNENYKNWEWHATRFVEEGWACVIFDFCGGAAESSSDGTLKDMTVLTEAEDLRCILEYVRTLSFVDTDRLFLQGDSMGGFVTSYLAPQVADKVKALVLWYPALVIPDDSRKRFEADDNTCFGMELHPEFNSSSMNIDIINVMSEYTGPVQLIHGDQDPVVPYTYSEKAHGAYVDSRLLILPGAGHGFDEDNTKLAMDCAIAFIKENI